MTMKNCILISTLFAFLTSCAPKLSTATQTELKTELKEMVKIDQVAASPPKNGNTNYDKEKWKSFKDSVFTANKNQLEKIYKKYGFLGFDKVGKDGSNDFWLLIQHLDKYPEFQQEVLGSMQKEVKKRNANPENYAFLYDRIKVNAGEKQLFGTQVTYEVQATVSAIPKNGLSDPDHVDALRKEYNLEPLKEYLNAMTEMHFEMNKARYEKIGVTKPNLY